MVNLMLDKEDLRTEREVVKEERRLRTEDNPSSKAYEKIGMQIFGLQKYGIPIIGTFKIGGKSFDITWTEATRIMETLQDAKHQYNVAERMGMLEPGTGTPIPVWSKTY